MALFLVSLLTFAFNVLGQNGTRQAARFYSLAGTEFSFNAVPEHIYAVITEPESQLNAQFHNMPNGTDVLVTALGFTHSSGHTATIQLPQCTSHDTPDFNVPGMAITVDYKPITINTTSQDSNSVTFQLLGGVDSPVKISYMAAVLADGFQEQLSIHTSSVVYAVHRRAGNCHLDVEVSLMDPSLTREGSPLLSGLLGMTAQWLHLPVEQHHLDINEQKFVESDLLSYWAPISTYGKRFVEEAEESGKRNKSEQGDNKGAEISGRDLLEMQWFEAAEHHELVSVVQPVAQGSISRA